MEKHGPAVWQTAYRLLGDEADTADCFQETFVSALKVSRQKPVRNFPVLLARLATARAIDRLRRRSRRSQLCQNGLDYASLPSKNPGPAQQLQKKELITALRQALGQLPKQEAQVFCLRHFNGLSYRQIGQELGIKANAAGVLLHRARAKLRECLEMPSEKKSEVIYEKKR